MNTVTAYIGLGTNLGDRLGLLREAIQRLDQTEGIRVIRLSSVFETDPVGLTDQPDFLNMVAEIETSLPPRTLLDSLLSVEQSLHRVRRIRWGPRTIDLDILLYGDQQMKEEDLDIPHPRMCERAFVLIPLQELAPDVIVPGTGRSVTEWLDQLAVSNEVRRTDDQISLPIGNSG
jgi:2-amino-4-hydroxy-6-hydroxymethyldihydropteridine diphosphokinase